MSNPFDSVNTLRTYPNDSTDKPEKVIVRNHWNYSDRVVLQIEVGGRDQTFTVLAEELKRAVDNATRAHR